MKLLNKLIALFIMAFTGAALLTACKKEERGEPRIDYIRITRPESSDSLLVGAGQGRLIAIVGDNLQDAVEIWFNDQAARLTPTYISEKSILVSVPNQIPVTVNNKVRIVFKNGRELIHDFKVEISAPDVQRMVLEYVKDGDIAVIRGDYFYEPLTVTFTGGAEGELVAVTDQEIQVRVPAGAQPGPVTVQTNFGTTKSNFWFRDNRNLLITNDPWSGWWGQTNVVPGTDPLAINGNYTRMTKSIGEWSWTEWIGGPENALSTSHNFPDDAAVNPSKYDMKFEINTLKPFTGNVIKFQIGQIFDPQPDVNAEPYQWKPPYDTKGKWETVTIPFEEVSANYKQGWGVRPQGYGVRVWFHGPVALDADIALDNLRVVPKVSQ